MYLAYCDDEPVQLEYVKHLAEQWSRETGTPLHFTAYGSAKELLFECGESYPYDLLILDIGMKEMDGMTLARRIREKDERLPILFLTNWKEYVFEGYEVHAIRYLLKPLNSQKLFPILDEISAAGKGEKKYLIVSVAGDSIKIDEDEILYLEASGHYVTLHTRMGDYEVKKTMTEISGELMMGETGRLSGEKGILAAEKSCFVSTHRSFLVNLLHVERIMRTGCVLSDGSLVPVSRNSYKALNDAFIA